MGAPYSSTRGKPHKNKDELAQRIDRKLRALRLHSGNEEFDPVEMMAIIGAEAYDDGDVQVALVAFKEVSQYVRPKLASTTVEHKEEPPVHSRARILGAFQKMGVKVNLDEGGADALVKELVERNGMSPEEARAHVEDNLTLPEHQRLPAPSSEDDE